MSDQLHVSVSKLPAAEGLKLPKPETEGSAGMDLRAALPHDEERILRPGERSLVPTGLKLALPMGIEAQIRPRSGLAHRRGITILNSPGTIDSDYRGEVKVLLINHGHEPFAVTRGQRVAQLVIRSYRRATLVEKDDLEGTSRGEGGFGHTGTQ
jgi:dUTP pyrophosphatase